MVDYSQHEQALILRQLITRDTPKILVDIGAHDGLCGSNSRELLEHGWCGLLVEPMPSVFERLVQNSKSFRNVEVVNAACGDHDGSARIRIGKDGADGQMASFSSDPSILENLTEECLEVPVRTLKTLFSEYRIPNDFGVLLVDTEGWDFTVLQGLRNTNSRPRIIVTEDLSTTDKQKGSLLSGLGYSCAGSWGGDSFWIANWHEVNRARLHLPVLKLPAKWKPWGKAVASGLAKVDEDASFRYTIAGWAWNEDFRYPETEVIISLRAAGAKQVDSFRAWSLPRPDVAAAFKSPPLLMSGFRANVNVPPGDYEVTVVQQGRRNYTAIVAGQFSLPVLTSALGRRSDSDYTYVCQQ